MGRAGFPADSIPRATMPESFRKSRLVVIKACKIALILLAFKPIEG
jgi:hypothetical protein